jgi:hypothetical protein
MIFYDLELATSTFESWRCSFHDVTSVVMMAKDKTVDFCGKIIRLSVYKSILSEEYMFA